MGAQIEQLPDLAGYLKIASHPEWRRVRLAAPGAGCERGAVARLPAPLGVSRARAPRAQETPGHEYP